MADGTDVADVAWSSVADADVVITVGYADCFVVTSADLLLLALISEQSKKQLDVAVTDRRYLWLCLLVVVVVVVVVGGGGVEYIIILIIVNVVLLDFA